MSNCLYCGKEVKNKYCNTTCQNKHRYLLKPHVLERAVIKKRCLKCDTEFEVVTKVGGKNNGEIEYCSSKCSHSRKRTPKIKEKIRNSCKEHYLEKNPIPKPKKKPRPKGIFVTKNCLNCGKEYSRPKSKIEKSRFCSNSCCTSYRNKYEGLSHKAGIKSISTQNRRSKNEVYFAELCSTHFKNVKTNEPIFNGWDADIILEDIKYAILWNGKWHYKKLTKKHSLLQVQNRDKIKVKEIIKCGYEPYIIKDMGNYKKSFVKEKFAEFLNFLNSKK